MQKLEKRQIGPHCILACLYFLLLPTTIAVNSAGNSILKLATVPIGLFFAVTLIFSNRKLEINGVHLSLLVYTLSAISTLFVDASDVSMAYVVGYVLNAAIYICLTVIPYNKAELELMEKTQILLLIILNALTLFSNGILDERTTLMIMGQTCDPNDFVGYFVFPLTVALKKLVSDKRSPFYLLLIAVSLYCVYLSGSRGGFLAIAVTIAGFAVIYPSNNGRRFLFFAGGLVLLVGIWIITKPLMPENIVERMNISSVVESGGSGRTAIWKSMIQTIIKEPDKLLFGRGIKTLHRFVRVRGWREVVAHNQLLQITYNQGLVGLLSFLMLTGVSFFRCVKGRKTVAIAILGMMALSISLSFNQTTRTFWNLIAYAAFAFPDSDTNTVNNGGLSDHESAEKNEDFFQKGVEGLCERNSQQM